MLYSRVTLYGCDNRPLYEARLNAETKKYDIVHFKGGDRSKARILKRGISSGQVLKMKDKLRASGGTGTVFN